MNKYSSVEEMEKALGLEPYVVFSKRPKEIPPGSNPIYYENRRTGITTKIILEAIYKIHSDDSIKSIILISLSTTSYMKKMFNEYVERLGLLEEFKEKLTNVKQMSRELYLRQSDRRNNDPRALVVVDHN